MKIKLLSCMFVMSLVAITPVEATWYSMNSKSEKTEQVKPKRSKRMTAQEREAAKEAAERSTLMGAAKNSFKKMLSALALAMRKVSESLEESSQKIEIAQSNAD